MKYPSIQLALLAGSALLLPLEKSEGATSLLATKDSEGRNLWAFEIGCQFITSNTVDEILFSPQDTHFVKGDAGGEVYTFTASRWLGEIEWKVGNSVFHPQMELPLTLEVVDENGRSPFLDYNAAYMMRWVDFPWNDKIETSFAMGVGLSYSSKVYLVDIEQHPGEDRSRLKIYWPIQFTFALPKYPKDQLTLFIAHQSGGHIFDAGGINNLGIGYRRGF